MAFESQLSEEWGENSTLDQLINDIFQDPTISAFINNYVDTDDSTQPPPSQASLGSPTPPSNTNSWRPWYTCDQSATTSHTVTAQVTTTLASPSSNSVNDSWFDFSQFTNVEVTLKPNFHDIQLHGKKGVVRSVADHVACVRIYSSRQDVRIPCDHLQPTTPRQSDLIKVIAGPTRGRIGTLVDIVGTAGVVQLQPSNGHIVNRIQVPLRHLGRFVTQIPTTRPAHLYINTLTPQSQMIQQQFPAYSPPVYSPTSPRHPYPFHSQSYPHTRSQTLPLPPPYPQVLSPPSNSSTSPLYHLGSPTYSRTPHCHIVSPTTPSCVQRFKQLQPFLKTKGHTSGTLKANCSVGSASRVVGGFSQPYHSVPVEKSAWHILEELLKKPALDYNFSSVAGSSEVKSTWEQISLVCPLSQRRIQYPCRSVHCKHLQCFDAEAYINFNHTQKPKSKLKMVSRSPLQPQADKRWKCPLCHKHAPYTQLYIDRVLLKIVRETSVNEVEFDKNGLWRPIEKTTKCEVIDLTCDSDDET